MAEGGQGLGRGPSAPPEERERAEPTPEGCGEGGAEGAGDEHGRGEHRDGQADAERRVAR